MRRYITGTVHRSDAEDCLGNKVVTATAAAAVP